MNNLLKAPIVGAMLLILFAIGVLIYNEKKTDELGELAAQNSQYLIRDYSPTFGDPNARVTIVEFFDPACETCKAFHPLVKKIMAANPGRVKLVMRYLPLHKGSDYVARFLEAARIQGKFIEALEALYAKQSIWASHHNPQPDKIWSLVGGSGLNLSKTREDMAKPVIAQRVQQDLSDARKLGVNKTPGFFVNGKPLVQFGYEQLRHLVNAEIQEKY